MSKASEQINPNDLDRYSVIPRVLVFLFQDDKVLLIKGSASKKLWAGKYNGLGGHLEQGEDPLQCARRELFEESALQGIALFLVGTVIVNTGSTPGVAIYIYKGFYSQDEVKNSTEGNLEWVCLNEIEKIPVVEDLRIILPRIYLMKIDGQPFSAKYYYNDLDQLSVEFTD
jgi:8-oxo-dGTP diphosphatase